jgi:hypothetical protein
VPDDSIPRHAQWDRFIDALDLAGQAGRIADVELPPLSADVPAGKRFGELTRADIDSLSKLASKLGRRTDVIMVLWQDMLRKKKPPRKKGLQSPRVG